MSKSKYQMVDALRATIEWEVGPQPKPKKPNQPNEPSRPNRLADHRLPS